MNRKPQDGQQSRRVILEDELAFVEVRNRLDERKPKAGSLIRSARIQSPKPPACLLAPLGRNTGSSIADFDSDLAFARLNPNQDFTPH